MGNYRRSNSGTFTEGDFQIGRQGLRISSTPSDLAEFARGSAASTKDAGGSDGGPGAGAASESIDGGINSRGNSARSGSMGGAPASASGGCGGGGGGVAAAAADATTVAVAEGDATTADSEDRNRGEASTSRGSDGGAGMFDIALEELEMLGVVGRGSSGSVQRALHTPSGVASNPKP